MNWTIRTKMIILLIPAIIIVLTIATVLSLQISSYEQKETEFNSTQNLARVYAEEFNTEMFNFLVISRTFSTVLDQNTGLTRKSVLDIQHVILNNNPSVIGVGVIFEPETFDGQDASYANTPGHDASGRFATYWNRINGTESLIPVVDIETSDWYTIPKETKKEVVMEPLLYENVPMTSFITPIIRNNTFTGTVGMDVPLQNIDRIVSNVKVFETGYAFLVSNTGIFISYPNKNFIGKMSLFKISQEKNNPVLAAMASDINMGKEGNREMTDPLTGKNVVMFYSPIRTGNWSMVVVAPTDEMLAGVKNLGTIMLIIALISIILIGVIVYFVSRNLSKPIIAMSRTADQIASGDLDINVPGQSGELGILANAFNNMAARLRELIDRLQTKVDELQNTQQALRKSEEKYRTLLESLPECIFVHRNGKILYANPAFQKELGYSFEELLNQSMMPIIAPEFHEKVETAIKQRMSGEEIIPYEIDIFEKDGSRKTMVIQGSLIDFEGAPASLNMLTDVTDRKRAEEKIKLANRKLALMTDVTYQDIQNKVTALRGFVDFSRFAQNEQNRLSTLKKEDEILETIHNLIKKTKEYQQMGIDKLRWVKLEHSIKIQTALVSGKSEIKVNIDLQGLEIYTDPLIDRVIYNFVDNAVKHGKTLTHISFYCHSNPEDLTIICEDDGVGIPNHEKNHIFNRIVGEGQFGLFFAHEFLTISGMTIKETGDPGKGARFEITVPKGMYRFVKIDNREDKIS